MSYYNRGNNSQRGWGRREDNYHNNSYQHQDRNQERRDSDYYCRDDSRRSENDRYFRGSRYNQSYSSSKTNHYSSSGHRRRESNQRGFGTGSYERQGYSNHNDQGPAPYQNESIGLSSKRTNSDLHNGASLTSQERQVKAKMEGSESATNHLSKQAFTRPDDWNEKIVLAVEFTIKDIIKKMEIKERDEDAFDSDNSDAPTPVGVNQGGISRHEREAVTKFIQNLADFEDMTRGFHIDANRVDEDKICHCPCSSKYGLEKCDADSACEYTGGQPSSLMDHLKNLGGLYECTERRKTILKPLACPYHHAARVFLIELYKDFNGTDNGNDVGHEALYPMNSMGWRKAMSARNRRNNREKQQMLQENHKLKSRVEDAEKKVIDLSKINKVLYDRIERFQSEKAKLGIIEEDEPELTNEEITEYYEDIKCQFDCIRYIVSQGNKFEPLVQPLKICVKSSGGKGSFNLQEFLDYLYDCNLERSAFGTKTDLMRCREVFFGDILCINEAEAAKKDKKRPTNNITMALVSEFNVIYSKSELYGTSKKAKEQQKLDTAIDEGGPSRQFINDTFLQMQTLAVPVRGSGKSILLFHQAEAGEKRGRVIDLVPRRDDELEWEVMKIVQPRCTEPISPEIEALVEETMTRVKEYSRVMGRMLLHAFICGHPVLSACMTPFYMNLILRGVVPSDRRYRRTDVVKHMDGVLCTQSDQVLSYWLEDGEKDDNGNPWTTDTIFSHRISKEFIESRSIILGGLIDGLSLRGKKDASKKLTEGSELRCILRNVPIEAISQSLFARPNLSFEDVHRVLYVVYSEGSNDLGETDEKLESFRVQQEEFYETIFLPYLREEAEKDHLFLSRFVEFCTGSTCLPYIADGNSAFQIKVEFDLTQEDPLAFPRSHTCTKDLVFPAHVYVRDADSFKEMMNMVIDVCRKGFEMH